MWSRGEDTRRGGLHKSEENTERRRGNKRGHREKILAIQILRKLCPSDTPKTDFLKRYIYVPAQPDAAVPFYKRMLINNFQ